MKTSSYRHNRTCDQCGALFIGHWLTRQCSDTCYLNARTTNEGDCWIWTCRAIQVMPPSTQEWVSLSTFVARASGKKITRKDIYSPTCGNPKCVKPSHFATKPRKGNTGGVYRGLTPNVVMAIYESKDTCAVTAKNYGVSAGLVSLIRRGHLHNKTTGYPKPAPKQ